MKVKALNWLMVIALSFSIFAGIDMSAYAAELEQSPVVEEEIITIELLEWENMTGQQFPVGTEAADILVSLPQSLKGYDSEGQELEVSITWQIPEGFDKEQTGTYQFQCILGEQYQYEGELPQIEIELIENQDEQIIAEEQETAEKQTNIGGEDAPTELKVNLLDNAYGIPKERVSFSWQNSLQNGMDKQLAYRIVISLRQQNVMSQQYTFDSGWIEDNKSTSVLFDLSSALQDNEMYYWQVQTKNGGGDESSLSEPQAFLISVGEQWKSTSGIWGSAGQKTVFLRYQLERPEKVERAIMNVTAVSCENTKQYVYNMYVNGQEVGIGPARQNGSSLYYESYDITDLLEVGSNAIGAIAYSEQNGALLCQVSYYMEDGTQKIVTNSGADYGKWKAMDADIVFHGTGNQSIGTGYYTAMQDNIDATRYPFNWNDAAYSASGWRQPIRNNVISNYLLSPSQLEPVKRYMVEAQSVNRKADGSYLVDLGEEIVGSIELSGTLQGSTITLEYGEQLDTAGNAKYRMNTGNCYQEQWRLKSGNQRISGIGMKTFRYVTIRNYRGNLSLNNVKGLAIRQEFGEDSSSFVSSNDYLNRLYSMMKYTSKMTTQDLYVDTQNRERRAYEGDALITAMTSYSFSAASPAAKFSAEYLLDNTTWPAEYSHYNIMLIYENYMYTGDIRDLEKSYQKLKGKTLEQHFDSSMGLMKEIAGADVAGQRIMVDWPASETDNYNITDSYYNTVFNAVCVGGYESMAKIAEELGYEGDRNYYQGLSDTIRSNMISKLYNSKTGKYYDGLDRNGRIVQHSAQHATAYALAFGVFENQGMADAMVETVALDRETKMSVYGTYFLLQGLYESNHGEVARKIMSNPDDVLGVKSWSYMMNGLGATIATEAWNPITKPNMSLCHPWGSAPGSMLVRGMFGIRPTSPGFDTFSIKVQPGGVAQASVKVPTMKGEIQAAYTIDGSGGMNYQVTVPSNAECTLYLPVNNGNANLTIDGNAVESLLENGYMIYTLPSGSHELYVNAEVYQDNSELNKTDVVYNVYLDNSWQTETTNGLTIGNTTGKGIEAIRFRIKNQDAEGSIEYSAHMQSYGWQEWKKNDATGGLPVSGKRLEAFRLRLTGRMAEKYDVFYRAYAKDIGWLDWAQNGGASGTSGYAKELMGMEVKLVRKGEEAPGPTAHPYKSTEREIAYSTHVQSYGWQAECGDGEVSGTVGSAKRLEAIRISLKDSEFQGGISYSTHVQSYGWQGWKSNGTVAGTEGQAKRLEAIKIKLTGAMAEKYDVYYRVHVQSFGWLGWAKNGTPAGSEGYAKRLEAIQIKLVKKGNAPPGITSDAFRKPQVGYRTHVQSYGWQPYVYDGAITGTSGQAKRLEGIIIQNLDAATPGSIQYKTHVQTYGWEKEWKSNAAMSGTSGQAKRLEAIQIKLTGDLEKKYDVYYRAHIQSYGWLGWAKNGEMAGSEGFGKRMEAMQIQYVEKAGQAPGKTEKPFVK